MVNGVIKNEYLNGIKITKCEYNSVHAKNNYLLINQMEDLSKYINIENAKYILIDYKGDEIIIPKSQLKAFKDYEIVYDHIYSVNELFDIMPKHIKYKNNEYELKIEKSHNVFYQNINNENDKKFAMRGNNLKSNLFYVYLDVLNEKLI